MNDENNSSSNNGNKGKFSERLKKIQSNKRRKKTNFDKYDNRRIFKPFLIISAFLYGAVKGENKKQDEKIDVSNKNADSYLSDNLQKVKTDLLTNTANEIQSL